MDRNSDYVGAFGYGSLVNRRTRTRNAVVDPFLIPGWRRSWAHCIETRWGNFCGLTIVPSADGEVAGVVVRRHRSFLTRLDRREQQYKRIQLRLVDEQIQLLRALGRVDVFAYTSEPPIFRPGNSEYPIWRSYLECVLAGFIDVGGHPAAEEFIKSTAGWETPILDDRATPKYPRAYRLPKRVQLAVDQLINHNGLDTNHIPCS
jgi:cation transport protein ChaC